MAKLKSTDVAEMPRSVHLGFNKKSDIPKGFDSLTLGQQVTLTVKGKVSSLNEDHYGAGMSLENFTVTIDKKSNLRPV